MVKIVYAVTIALFCLGVLAVYWAIHARKRAIAEQEKIHRVFADANRALGMIESEDPNQIIVGLHMLSVYDIPSVRMKAFPRLMKLKEDDNKQVAQLAEYIMELSQSREPSVEMDKSKPQ